MDGVEADARLGNAAELEEGSAVEDRQGIVFGVIVGEVSGELLGLLKAAVGEGGLGAAEASLAIRAEESRRGVPVPQDKRPGRGEAGGGGDPQNGQEPKAPAAGNAHGVFLSET